MKLRANVTQVTDRTRHGVASIQVERIIEVLRLQPPAWVEITESDGLFYLLTFDAMGASMSDTCHLTLEEAKRQALFEFNITANEWLNLE